MQSGIWCILSFKFLKTWIKYHLHKFMIEFTQVCLEGLHESGCVSWNFGRVYQKLETLFFPAKNPRKSSTKVIDFYSLLQAYANLELF